MKIKLSDEQKKRLDTIFKEIVALRNDKNFMQMYEATIADDEQKLVTDDNEDDYARIVNVYDDLYDHVKEFNLW